MKSIKFVSSLTEEEISELEDIIKNNQSSRARNRAHSIILSKKGFNINEIANIFQVNRDSVSSWIDRWESSGCNGLFDLHRDGRPTKLTEKEKEIAIDLIKEYPQSIKTVKEKLYQKTDKIISSWTLKRLAKASNLKWKRIRKSLKSKRNKKEFKQAKKEIQELKQQEQSGKIDLYYFDETGFDLTPTVPYAWQPNGETIEIPSSKSPRINVLGFINTDNKFESFMFEASVNSDVVIACFDSFSKTITNKTVVIIDNASTHTSKAFNKSIKNWEEKGLFIKRLPPYSPELNLIEILWRFIKYKWLPFSAYNSLKDLVNEVENVLKNIGTTLQIKFA